MIIYKNIHRNKLHQELIDGGIDATKITVKALDGTDYGASIDFADGTDMTLVQSIIEAHDPTPIPSAPSEVEQIRLEVARSNAEMFEAVIALMGGM